MDQKKSQDYSILVENLSVHYERSRRDAASLKELFVYLFQRDALKLNRIRALNGINLAIQPGEVYGVIGRNGSGKSTLLKALSRIIRPTEGRIQIWGKISPLLGVGSGFHQELTGRENVFLYSAILGRSAERTHALFDEIVSFAEVEDFIDEPIRVYSSGMTARLGFAVAMAERPEILLVDEVLSVGDERFKDKCNERFHSFSSSGTTVVFVSHNLQAVAEMCGRSSWINKGDLMATGDTKDVLSEYKKYMQQNS